MVERGVGKVEFLALWPQIEEKLGEGYPVNTVWAFFQGDSLSVKKRRFLDLVREQQQRSPSLKQRQRFSPQTSSPSPQPPRQRLTEHRADSSPSKPQTFQHDPRPLKDYFAKGAGS